MEIQAGEVRRFSDQAMQQAERESTECTHHTIAIHCDSLSLAKVDDVRQAPRPASALQAPIEKRAFAAASSLPLELWGEVATWLSPQADEGGLGDLASFRLVSRIHLAGLLANVKTKQDVADRIVSGLSVKFFLQNCLNALPKEFDVYLSQARRLRLMGPGGLLRDDGFVREQFVALMRKLTQSTEHRLREISFENWQFCGSPSSHVSLSVPAFRHLESLSLSGNSFHDGVVDVSSIIASCSALRRLELNYIEVGNGTLEPLFEEIEKLHHLRVLGLNSRTSSDRRSMRALASLLPKIQQLRVLRLSAFFSSAPDEREDIVDSIAQMNCLRTLELARNSLPLSAMSKILREQPSLEVVDFSGNNFGTEPVHFFCESLITMHNLKHFYFVDNTFNQPNVWALLECAASLPQIESFKMISPYWAGFTRPFCWSKHWEFFIFS